MCSAATFSLLLLSGTCLFQISLAQRSEALGQRSVDEVAQSLQSSPVRQSAPRRADPASLRTADAQLRGDQNEQNFRSLFSTSAGPQEFFSSDAASSSADNGVQSTQRLMQETNQASGIRFADNGNPANEDVARVNAKVAGSCVYDLANSAPCESDFKEATGRCTNVIEGRKTWGMAGTPFSRILPPKYEDGLGARKVTTFHTKVPMKSPREITTTVTTTNVILNFDGVSAHVMQWGQFIAHEYTQLGESEPGVACCPDQIFQATNGRPGTRAELQVIRELVAEVRGDVCQQIELQDDPVYGKDVCMSHTRSRAAPQHNCVFSPRQQMNAVTHVFDASNVYGSSLSEQNALRDTIGGRMKVVIVNNATLPPQETSGCPVQQIQTKRCPFAAGDNRINTTPNLISAHTAFIVKHNQIADELSRINPSWNHEKLFQESRRIISAIQSNIHFYEWLPIVIGSSVRSKFRLTSYDGFDENVNPSVLNELAAGAGRFGHSLIGGLFQLIKDNGVSRETDLLPSFFDSQVIYNDGTKQCVRGLSADVPWIADRNFPSQIRDQLFRQQRDLIALNLNRGRDHGFNSYVDYRRHYGLSVPRSFNDLSRTHPADARRELENAYADVRDIELYIGAITEFPVRGGLVGELFANILADGFSRSRKGDRLFFESQQGGLTRDQISAIRGYSYAQLQCESHGLDRIVSKMFFTAGSNGAREVSCSSFPRLNLDLWDEKSSNPGVDSCQWKVIRTTPCCRGNRITTRRCVKTGRSNCQCSGSRIVRESCSCRRYSDCPGDFFLCFKRDRGGSTDPTPPPRPTPPRPTPPRPTTSRPRYTVPRYTRPRYTRPRFNRPRFTGPRFTGRRSNGFPRGRFTDTDRFQQ